MVYHFQFVSSTTHEIFSFLLPQQSTEHKVDKDNLSFSSVKIRIQYDSVVVMCRNMTSMNIVPIKN